jgi:predicted small lipoprotein YifL
MNNRNLCRVGSGVAFGATLLLAACGQKGPLYLPDTGGEVVTRPGGAAQSTPQPSQQPPQPIPSETAPPPSTQTPASTTPKSEDEKKSPPR